MNDRAKDGIDPNSPWAKANRRPSKVSAFFGKLLVGALFAAVAALFCWMVIEEPLQPSRKLAQGGTISDAVARAHWKAEIERADRIMKEVQDQRAAGKPIGIVDGTIQALSPDQARQMVDAHRIREAFRSLQMSYVSFVQQGKIRGSKIDPASIERDLNDAKIRAIAELKKCPVEDVQKVYETFRPFLGSDEGALTLFQEVSSAIRN